ncbi:MAG: anaerobic ribonucleoside-triphosphate reductase, partial [Bacillota bacterium]
IDDVLEGFIDTVSPAEAERLLRMFLVNIDRTLPDAFVHMNIGPRATTVGRLVLKLEGELKKAVPNLSLKFSEETPPDFARLAVATALETSKPYFVNHAELRRVFGGDEYGLASCYNSLKIGGGSFTLVRLNLKEAARRARDYDHFMAEVLPEAIDAQAELINARIRFIVEEAGFFESSFLVQEGLIDRRKFTAMAGFFGLYEGVQALSGGRRMGHDQAADEMGLAIMGRAHDLVKTHKTAYGEVFGGLLGVHAQSGIDTDVDVTAGVRFRIGDEPALYDQIRLQSALQRHFDTGVSDIYIFEANARDNPDGVLRIVRGAMKNGMRIMALNTSDSELIRITGYLVKRCEVDRYFRGEPLREGTVKLGADSIRNNRTLERRVRAVREGEGQ